MKLTKRRIVWGAAVAALMLMFPFLLLFAAVTYGEARDYLHRVPFESTAWKNPDLVESDDPIRIRMVDDLMKSRRLEGRSREEVEKMLGKAAKPEDLREFDLVYWLGPDRVAMGTTSEWLAISLDERGVVREYGVVRD
jgi:hypothetical protein